MMAGSRTAGVRPRDMREPAIVIKGGEILVIIKGGEMEVEERIHEEILEDEVMTHEEAVAVEEKILQVDMEVGMREDSTITLVAEMTIVGIIEEPEGIESESMEVDITGTAAVQEKVDIETKTMRKWIRGRIAMRTK
jgi:hypothetical protein